MNSKIISIIVCVVICLVVGFTSGMSTASSIETWYTTLNKPALNPPNWIFAPVWTLLYIFMGISVGRIWNKFKEGETSLKSEVFLFFLHLLLNALWSVVFFGLQNPVIALVIIIVLWLMILRMILVWKKHDALASNLLIPYLLWVSFATYLNVSIVLLN